jgi:hypothetical protein
VGEHLQYLYPSEWYVEEQPAVFTFTLREPAAPETTGAVIPVTSLATCTLTLYDLSGGAMAVVNNVAEVNIKNTGRATISTQGVVVLTLTEDDMAILNATHAYEVRQAHIAITWPATPTKSDVYRITFVVQEVSGYPYVAPAP